MTLEECECKCGCGKTVDESFLERIDKARIFAGIPFVVNSGARCMTHNIAVGGSKSSSHLNGVALDLKAETSNERYWILNGLITVGFNRIGIGKDFIHVDDDKSKPSGVVWIYND